MTKIRLRKVKRPARSHTMSKRVVASFAHRDDTGWQREQLPWGGSPRGFEKMKYWGCCKVALKHGQAWAGRSRVDPAQLLWSEVWTWGSEDLLFSSTISWPWVPGLEAESPWPRHSKLQDGDSCTFLLGLFWGWLMITLVQYVADVGWSEKFNCLSSFSNYILCWPRAEVKSFWETLRCNVLFQN